MEKVPSLANLSGNEQENITPIYGPHYYSYLHAEMTWMRWGWNVIARSKVPERLTFWKRSSIDAVRGINPSVIAFDSLSPNDENIFIFANPGNPYQFRGEGQRGSDIFFVGADIADKRRFYELFPQEQSRSLAKEASQRFLEVEAMIGRRTSLINLADRWNDFVRQLALRNAFLATKTVEARIRLGSKVSSGPTAVLLGKGGLLGSGHNIAHSAVVNKQEREEVLLSIFKRICEIAIEINNGPLDQGQTEKFVTQLSNAFGLTTVWRLVERPRRKRLRVDDINALLPVEDTFVSPTISRIVKEAVDAVLIF